MHETFICKFQQFFLKVKIIQSKYFIGKQPTKGLSTNEINVERLNTLEFTSDRKRMSVILKDGNGDIWLYTKGAESHVFPLCKTTPSQLELLNVTQRHIDDFAKIGLRTLAVARRKLTPEEYQEFDIGE